MIDKETDVLAITKDLIVKLDLKKRDRHPEKVIPRHYLMWYLRRYTDMSLKEIAREFDRNHSDVLYACRKVKGYKEVRDKYWLTESKELREYIDQFNFELPGPPEGPIVIHMGMYVDNELYKMVMASVKKEGVNKSAYLRSIIREHELNKSRKI
jgi:hypothetical protein